MVTEDIFNAKAQELKAEARTVEQSLEDVETGDDLEGFKPLKIFDFSQKVEKIWCGSSFEKKRALLQLVSSNRHVSDVSLYIEKTKPFDVLAKRPFLRNSGRYRT